MVENLRYVPLASAKSNILWHMIGFKITKKEFILNKYNINK